MGRQGKAGVQVVKRASFTEVSFWGSVNGVPQRLYMERLVDPSLKDIAVLTETKLNELRALSGR